MFIPVNEPLLLGNEKKYLLNCLKNNEISSTGSYVKLFEKKFALKVKRKYAIAVSNGTAALQIAFEALGIKKKQEVILPSFTIISCLLPVLRIGAKPIFVDCDPKTWNLDVTKLHKLITKKTAAIIAPHIYGMPIDMDPLIKIAKKFKLKIIEDAAEVLGLNYNNRPCGSFGDVSTFSFYANKHITTGEGGMIVTNNKKIADKCRSLRNICFNNKRRFLHYKLGWNQRLTNIQAAIGLAQLEKLDLAVKKKRTIGGLYQRELKKFKFLHLPLDKNEYAKNIYWVFGIVLKKNINLSVIKLMNLLEKKGIETRNFFWPLHLQPLLKKEGYHRKIKLPVSEYISQRGIYLPSGLSLTAKKQTYIIKHLIKILKKYQYK
jgi:perosamine synthetase